MQYRLFEMEDKRQAHGIVLRLLLRSKNKNNGGMQLTQFFYKKLKNMVGYEVK